MQNNRARIRFLLKGIEGWHINLKLWQYCRISKTEVIYAGK